MVQSWDSLDSPFRFYIKISEKVDFKKWTQNLNRLWVQNILLQCCFDMQNFIGKSVTILKLLIRAIYCRQAETHSSIRLDSTSKRVRTFILRNCKKMCGGIILQNGIILFTKTCRYRCMRFLNSKKVILNTGLIKMVIISSDLKSNHSFIQLGLLFCPR